MGIKIVRQPSAQYIVKSGTKVYAEDDINLTESIGYVSIDMPAIFENLVYGKIISGTSVQLVSTKDMIMVDNVADYNTISNVDDFIGLRHAYGNQNGYVPFDGYSRELNCTYTNERIIISSGLVVVDGVEVNFESGSIDTSPRVDFDDLPKTGNVFVTIYLSVRPMTNTATLEKIYDTTRRPVVDKGADLTANPNGKANLELYSVHIKDGVVQSVSKLIKPIGYYPTAVDGVLRYDGDIIERKKLLWSGSFELSNQEKVLPIDFASVDGNQYFEVIYNNGYFATHMRIAPVISGGGFTFKHIDDIVFGGSSSIIMTVREIEFRRTLVSGGTLVSCTTTDYNIKENDISDRSGGGGTITAIYQIL